MEVSTIKDAFDRVAKKQKLCYSKTQEVINHLERDIQDTLEKVQPGLDLNSQSGFKSILTELKTKLKESSPLAQLEGVQKELNVALSKYPKLLEKSFNPDISKAHRNIEFDRNTINLVLASHFYCQGLFEMGDCFVDETMDPESVSAIKSPYVEMYKIVEALKGQDLGPALEWAAANQDKLKNSQSDLEFKLHQMRFVQILQGDGRDKAFSYIRTYLAPFSPSHISDIQKLMCCLLWARKLEQSPYTNLLSPANWDVLSMEVTKHFLHLMGQSYKSPLSVTIAAGVQGLPPLLKFMNVMEGKKQERQTMKQLPVPVKLDDEFQFHSVFVCPVSKEQATEDDPPMLMSCGHVLCKQSIVKLSKNFTRSFKCSYCPSDIDASLCRQLNF